MISKKRLTMIEEQILSCELCPRLREVTLYPMPHIIMQEAIMQDFHFMIIGRNPGLEHSYEKVKLEEFWEFYKRGWWVCKIGTYIQNVIGNMSVRRHLIFANTCKCSSPANSSLETQEKNNCRNYLKRQIYITKPVCILTMGADAREAVRHPQLSYVIDNIDVFNMRHPASFGYNPEHSQTKIFNEFYKHFVDSIMGSD